MTDGIHKAVPHGVDNSHGTIRRAPPTSWSYMPTSATNARSQSTSWAARGRARQQMLLKRELKT
eukprot:2683535-Amphidinium_carterae.1